MASKGMATPGSLLLLLSFREFRAAGTSVRGTERTTTIVRTGYLAFILSVPAVGFIAAVVIAREERFLERNFHDQYSSYKATVRRWL